MRTLKDHIKEKMQKALKEGPLLELKDTPQKETKDKGRKKGKKVYLYPNEIKIMKYVAVATNKKDSQIMREAILRYFLDYFPKVISELEDLGLTLEELRTEVEVK